MLGDSELKTMSVEGFHKACMGATDMSTVGY